MATQDSPFKQLVKSAKRLIREIDRDAVKEKIGQGADFLLIDVREKDEWLLGHIRSAFYLSKGVIERDINELASNFDKPIVLYCGGGSRSALAADNLRKMGYTNVSSMMGGFRGWQAANYPIDD